MNQLSKNNQFRPLESLPNTTSKEIRLYNESNLAKKLKDFSTKEDLLLMNSLILRWAQYVGIKQPDALEVNTIANYLKENFKNLNHYDISECINLLVKQELKTDAEHYGSLTVIYVSKVLKAYQSHKSEILFKVREQITKQESMKTLVFSDDEKIGYFKSNLLMAKEAVSKEEIHFDMGDVIYDFLKKNKLVKLNQEFIKEAVDYGASVAKKQSSSQALKDVMKNATFSKVDKTEITKRHAREYVVNWWLKNTDVADFCKKITIEML